MVYQLFDDNSDGRLEFEEYERFHTNLVKAFNKHEVSPKQLTLHRKRGRERTAELLGG